MDAVGIPVGTRVKLRPRAGGDVFDLALAGKTAVVDVVETDSFQGSRLKLEEWGLGEETLEINVKAAQIARYAPDNSLIGVTSLNSNTVSLIDPSFRQQTAIKVGNQPMDMAFRGDELFVACQGDGSVHVIDIANKRHKTSFKAGKGCESLAFY